MADKSRLLQELETDLQKTTVVFTGLLFVRYNDIRGLNILSRGLLRIRKKEKCVPRVSSHVVSLTTIPQPLPERILHRVRSSALSGETTEVPYFQMRMKQHKGITSEPMCHIGIPLWVLEAY